MESSASELFNAARLLHGWHTTALCLALVFGYTGAGAAKQPEVILRGHSDFVTALAFSPDGKILASAGYDKSVRVWDMVTAKALVVLRVDKPALEIAFTPDGGTLVTANEDHTDFWDVKTWKKLRSFAGGCPLAIAPDGKSFTSSGPQVTLLRRDIQSGKELAVFRTDNSVAGSAVFLQGGKALVTTGNGQVRCWDAASGKPISAFPNLQPLYDLAVSPDGKTLAQVGGKELYLWEIDTNKDRFTFSHDNRLYYVAFSPDGKMVALSTDDAVLLVDAATGKLLKTLGVPSADVFAMSPVTFSPDGKILASSSGNHGIRLWKGAEIQPKGP